jgi:hypothetical protein
VETYQPIRTPVASICNTTVRTIISAPPLQNAVNHTTAAPLSLSGNGTAVSGRRCIRFAVVWHGILQRRRAYDCTHCIRCRQACFWARSTVADPSSGWNVWTRGPEVTVLLHAPPFPTSTDEPRLAAPCGCWGNDAKHSKDCGVPVALRADVGTLYQPFPTCDAMLERWV